MLISLATIAGCITALVGIFLMARRDAKQKAAENYAYTDQELLQQLKEATTDEERIRIYNLLSSHRNGK